MSNVFYIVVAIFTFCKFVNCQGLVDDECIFKSTGTPGVCKLLNECTQELDDLEDRSPQTCGYQGTQPIICCSTEKRRPQRRPGEISKKKCSEYSEYVFVKRRAPIGFNIIITRNECGHKVLNLIPGEHPASRKEFPHMAAVGFGSTPGENVQWLCEGAILSDRFILTTAHCLNNTQGEAKWVKLGVTDLNTTHHQQEIRVAERIPYPEYRSGSHYHDIGLLRLETPAKLNPYARPACLYLEHDINVEKAIATGWGPTSSPGSRSNTLRKVTQELFDHAFCNSSWKNQIGKKLARGIDDEIQFCAGSASRENNTCGDSGGLLQIYHISQEVKCMYDIIGVTSVRKPCSDSPDIYARISYYVKWIEDIVWPQLP